MKKLMIAAAIVCAAVASQAATFNWSSTSAVKLVDAMKVIGNGDYDADGVGATKTKATLTYLLTILDGGNVVGTASGTVAYSTTGNKFKINGIEVAAAEGGKAYDYTIVLSGSQKSIRDLPEATIENVKYNYAASTLETTLSGKVTTSSMGVTELSSAVPTTWTVGGIVATQAPEPTSAMLLLLGVAGLALKRKQK